jgi:hypothetical protein
MTLPFMQLTVNKNLLWTTGLFLWVGLTALTPQAASAQVRVAQQVAQQIAQNQKP